MRNRHLGCAAVLALASLAPTAGSAAPSRAWVSGHGVDQSGCGAPTAPCRSLQYVHDHVVAAGGEIDVLDPAGYGALTITKALSIVNDGIGTAGVQATSGSAITINAGVNDTVYLRGLNIDGQQMTAANGVTFSSGRGLTIVNCVVRHFSNDGVLVQPTSGQVSILVSNTIAAENGVDGIGSTPASGSADIQGTLEHVIATRNGAGGVHVTEGAAGTANYTVVDSVLSDNAQGLWIQSGNAGGPSVILNVDMTHMDSNINYGLGGNGPFSVHLSRSVMDQNHFVGIENGTTLTGRIFTTGDNRVEGNALGAVDGSGLTSEPLS